MSMYARLGTMRDVDLKIAQAQELAEETGDDTITIKVESDTVEISVAGKIAMRAIAKDGKVWLCLYNPEFYPMIA